MSTQETNSSSGKIASERIFKLQLIMYPEDEEKEKRMLTYALRTMIMETNHQMRKHIYLSRVLTIKGRVYDDNIVLDELQDIAVEMIKPEHIKCDEDFGMTYSRAFLTEMDKKEPPRKQATVDALSSVSTTSSIANSVSFRTSAFDWSALTAAIDLSSLLVGRGVAISSASPSS